MHTQCSDYDSALLTGDQILNTSLICLAKYHLIKECGDRTMMDAFNRLLAKNYLMRNDGRTREQVRFTHLNIKPDEISSQKTRQTAEWVAGLTSVGSIECQPTTDCPIVLAVYMGQMSLLDGNKRVRWWLNHEDKELHRIHIHTVTAVGEFVEHEPIV